MELDDPPHHPRRSDPRDRPLAHRLRWGWGPNRDRDVRLVMGLALVALIGAGLWGLAASQPRLDADGRAYVRAALDVPRTDDDLDAIVRAVCGSSDPTVALGDVAARATAEVGFPVSLDVAHRVREAACPPG